MPIADAPQEQKQAAIKAALQANERIEQRQADVLNVDCPVCLVPRGSHCLTDKEFYSHSARARAYRAQQAWSFGND
jgi:hypothetical protein